MAGVMEVDSVLGAGLLYQLLQCRHNPCAGRRLIGHHLDVLLREAPSRDQDVPHGLDVIDRALQARQPLILVDANQQRSTSRRIVALSSHRLSPDKIVVRLGNQTEEREQQGQVDSGDELHGLTYPFQPTRYIVCLYVVNMSSKVHPVPHEDPCGKPRSPAEKRGKPVGTGFTT